MGNKKHKMVGAPRFELGTSCAQARRVIFSKFFLCTTIFRTKDFLKRFSSGRTCETVAPHAQGPRIFPILGSTFAPPSTLAVPLTRFVGQRSLRNINLNGNPAPPPAGVHSEGVAAIALISIIKPGLKRDFTSTRVAAGIACAMYSRRTCTYFPTTRASMT
jgi:hypothetical protein